VKYLLDTCVLSEFVKITPDSNVLKWFAESKAHELFTGAMNMAELHRGVAKLTQSKRRSDLINWLQKLEIGFEDRILAFDINTAKVWAEMVADAEAKGKTISAFDSIVAATARAQGCQLVTRNVSDFSNSGVNVINPWE
jgi:predicted nucleic acid-binding protein